MQHERAREKADGSGWYWVGSHTPDCRMRRCKPHATKEEAEQCQYEYELANAREHEFTSARPCVECKTKGVKTWTPKALTLGGYMGDRVRLCDDHRTIDILRKHTSASTERWVS